MPADQPPLSILKLGGSLLSLPDVADRLISFVDQHQVANPAVVVGGGDAANLVRDWAQRFELSDSAAHDLALKAMTLNSELLSHLSDRFVLADEPGGCGVLWRPEQIAVLQILPSVARLEAKLSKTQHLPKSWDVTSDSIAAWLALYWNAERLYLLKSIDFPTELNQDRLSREQLRDSVANRLAQRGFVDGAFAEFAKTIPSVAWCNLRRQGLELLMF